MLFIDFLEREGTWESHLPKFAWFYDQQRYLLLSIPHRQFSPVHYSTSSLLQTPQAKHQTSQLTMMSNYTSNKPTTATADPKWAHFVVEKTHYASFSIPAGQDHGEVSIDSSGHIDTSKVDFPVVVHQNINGDGDDDANVDMFDDPSPDVTDADCDKAYDKTAVLGWVPR